MADLHFTPTSKRDERLVKLVRNEAKKRNLSVAAMLRVIFEERWGRAAK